MNWSLILSLLVLYPWVHCSSPQFRYDDIAVDLKVIAPLLRTSILQRDRRVNPWHSEFDLFYMIFWGASQEYFPNLNRLVKPEHLIPPAPQEMWLFSSVAAMIGSVAQGPNGFGRLEKWVANGCNLDISHEYDIPTRSSIQRRMPSCANLTNCTIWLLQNYTIHINE